MQSLKVGDRYSPNLTLLDHVLLSGRRYELHNEKVIKYFVSKYGKHVDDYLLIVNFGDGNPWKPLMNFLKCHPANSNFANYVDNYHHQSQTKDGELSQSSESSLNFFDIYNAMKFPHSNTAPSSQLHDIIPRNMTFDWENHVFSQRYLHWISIGEKYYQYPYSMQHKYFQSVNHSNYINLYASVYQPYVKVVHN